MWLNFLKSFQFVVVILLLFFILYLLIHFLFWPLAFFKNIYIILHPSFTAAPDRFDIWTFLTISFFVHFSFLMFRNLNANMATIHSREVDVFLNRIYVFNIRADRKLRCLRNRFLPVEDINNQQSVPLLFIPVSQLLSNNPETRPVSKHLDHRIPAAAGLNGRLPCSTTSCRMVATDRKGLPMNQAPLMSWMKENPLCWKGSTLIWRISSHHWFENTWQKQYATRICPKSSDMSTKGTTKGNYPS